MEQRLNAPLSGICWMLLDFFLFSQRYYILIIIESVSTTTILLDVAGNSQWRFMLRPT